MLREGPWGTVSLPPSLFAPEFTSGVQRKPSAVGEVVEAFVRGSPNELAEHREHMVALVFRHGRGALTHIAPLNGRFQRERPQPIEKPPPVRHQPGR